MGMPPLRRRNRWGQNGTSIVQDAATSTALSGRKPKSERRRYGSFLCAGRAAVAMMQSQVVIVGAGHAGFQVAASLHQLGFAGPVHLINDEGHLPYQRPPLSK